MSMRNRGFTLVEMLVAMLAFALLATVGVAILNAGLRNSDVTARASAAIKQIQMARAIMKADLGQIADRPVRHESGAVTLRRAGLATTAPVLETKDREKGPLLSFVRRGWDNPGGREVRSSLQYVEYIWEDKALVRRARPYLDPTPETPVTESVILSGVNALAVSFVTRGQRVERWVGLDRSDAMPDAIEIAANLEGIGELKQMFLVGEPKGTP
jgi:general secretion pathway protein J